MVHRESALPSRRLTEDVPKTIADIVAALGASRLILGAPHRHAIVNLLRGNLTREVSAIFPEEIDLLVCA